MSAADVWRLYQSLVRRRWVFAATAGTCLAIVALGCLLLPRYYRAQALVMPSEEALSAPAVTPSGSTERQPGSPELRSEKLADLISLAQSQAVLDDVKSRLGLRESPQSLARRIRVEPLPRTTIIGISVLDKQPEQAVRIASTLAASFAEFYQDLSHRGAVQTRRFLEDNLEAAERALEKAEKALADFYATDGEARPPVESQAAINLERESVLASLRGTAARLKARRAQLARLSPTLVREEKSTDSPIIAQLRAELATLEGELASERAVHTESHPNIVRLTARIEDLNRRLREETNRLVSRRSVSANPQYEALMREIADLEAEKAALTAKMSALDEASSQQVFHGRSAAARSVELAALTRARDLAAETQARLKTAVDQARIDESVTTQTGTIRVVDLPKSAQGPLTRGAALWQIALMGVALSIALGVLAALGADFLDDRVRTREDLRRLLEMPVTAVIPAMPAQPAALPAITHLEPISPYAEAYRFLRTDVLFTARDHMVQTIMVATPKPGQGGTTTICNLAIAMAEAEQRVILVDADLRRPSIHKIFNLNNDVGLSSVLSNGVELGQALQQTSVPNLLVLTGGPTPKNPSRLINSRRMSEVIHALRRDSDFVLFDTPSAVAFSDAAILASMVDGVLLVVRAQESPRGSELQVKDLLNKAKANVLGVVLNAASPETVDSFFYHSRYYQRATSSGPDGSGPASLPEPSPQTPEPHAASEPDEPERP